MFGYRRHRRWLSSQAGGGFSLRLLAFHNFRLQTQLPRNLKWMPRAGL
jgi:hypothetical protein